MNSDARQLWTDIRVPDCQKCPLNEEAQSVCLIGDGPVPADIMIIGEAPGYREDEIGKPFQGRAGQVLDAALQSAGLNRDEAFITNVAKCRPPDNRTPTKTELKACREYLDEEIERVKPKFILTLGNSALSLIKKSGIMKHRGEVYEYNGAKVLPTVHPAAVLRNPKYQQTWKADIQAFARLVKGETGATPPKVYIIRDKRGLITACKAILASEAVAYDLETNGFDDFAPDAKIAVISISPKPGVAFVIPIEHPEASWKRPMSALSVVGNALIYTKGRRIAHNAKFDDRWLQRFGVNIHADFDTMIAAHLLDENRFKGLKPLAQILLGADAWKDVDLSDGGALTTPLKKLAPYAAKDADYTLRLYYKFRDELTKPENRRTLRLFQLLMMPASKAITVMERNGIWVNQKRLLKRSVEAKSKLDEIHEQLVEITGEEANWNSSQQIASILFGKLKLPLVETTAKGAPSTKESVLLQLRKEHKVADLLLEWRKWSKYYSTYLTRWAEVTDERGRIHPNYKLTGTVTGRLSSGKEEGQRGRGLNVQQVPRDPFIRTILGTPTGWRFVEADFSQIELRVAAHYSGDLTMQRAFRERRDIHLETAVSVTGKPPAAITKEERKKAKAVNFGFLYGMGWRKFIEYARDNYDVVVSDSEAQIVRKRFFTTYQSLSAWHDRQRRLVRRHKKVQSALGRVRHLPDIDSGDEGVRAEAERQAINSPVQAMASDMMLLSMVLLHEKLNPDEARMVGTVHDSLLFEIREDKVDEIVKLIRQTMENLPLKKKFGVELSVPIVVDIKVGQHWSEGEEV